MAELVFVRYLIHICV